MAIAIARAAAALVSALALSGAAQAQTMYRVTYFAPQPQYAFDLTANDDVLALSWNGDRYSAFKCPTRRCRELPKQPRTDWTAMNDSGVLMGWMGKKRWPDGSMIRKRPGMPVEKFAAHPAELSWPAGGRPIAPDGAMVGVDPGGNAVIITDTLQVLPGLTDRGSLAYGINAAHVVVGLSVPAEGHHHATMWINGEPHDLGVPPGHVYSAAYDVNDFNVAVGYSYIPGKLQQAARFSPGSSAVTLQPPGNIRESRAYSINNNGEIVGTMWNTDGAPRAFVVEGDTLVDLNERISVDDRAQYYFTYATAINDKGKIVARDERHGAAVLLEPIKAVKR